MGLRIDGRDRRSYPGASRTIRQGDFCVSASVAGCNRRGGKRPVATDRFRYRLGKVDEGPCGDRWYRPDGGLARLLGAHRREQRSEEHTSELQSLTNIVCRLLL